MHLPVAFSARTPEQHLRVTMTPGTPTDSALSLPSTERQFTLLALGVAAVPLAVLFTPTFVRLVGLWETDPNYSHGYAVPFIFAWLIWRHFREAGWPRQGEVGPGLFNVAAGCVVHLAAVLTAWPPFDFFALVLILRGLAITAGGRDWARGLMFPILFLFFMFPLPATWTGTAALWLQDAVSRAAAGLLDPFIVCLRKGNSLYLAGVPDRLIVGEECSGLRQMVAFVALAALIGHLSRRPPTFGILLVLLAVPIALAANVIRVLLMAVGAINFGTDWLHGLMHHTPAAFTVPLGLALLLLTAWVLGRFWQPTTKEAVACSSVTA